MESKPEVQKKLICSESREGTGKSSGSTRFSNTVYVQQNIVVNGNWLQAEMRKKI